MRDGERLDRVRIAVLAVLGVAGVVSLATGVRHGLLYGCHDLQWIGAWMVRQRMDPWQEELLRFPHHFAHFSPPNYLHLLYMVLLPLGFLNFETAEILWTAGSVGLSIACVLLLRRLFDLTGFQTALALFLLWMSSPFRVVLEVGQMSFFELFFLTGAYVAVSTALGGVSLGMSLAKYSFSPAAVLLFLFRGRVKLLAYAFLVAVIGLVGVWLMVGTPLVKLAMEPLAVSALPTAVSPGFADLMTLAEHTLKLVVADARARQLSYALGLLGSAAYAFLLSRFRLSRAAEFTLISLASLFFVKHLVYDYVFLVVLLCFALKQESVKVKAALIAGVLAFWFVLPVFARETQLNPDAQLGRLGVTCGVLAALLIYTTRLVLADAGRQVGVDS